MEFIDIFKEKYEQLIEDDVDKALEYCMESLELSKSADIYVYIGDALMINEDFEDAVKAISKGIKENCVNKLWAYSLKGEALFYLDRYKESREAFNEVRKSNINNFFACVYLIDIDIVECKYIDGINRLDLILNSNTLNNEDEAFMKTKKGWIMFKYLESQEAAYILFKEALNKDKFCATAYVGLGCYYLYKNEYVKSIKNYENALELGEDSYIVYEGLEQAKEKRGNINE